MRKLAVALALFGLISPVRVQAQVPPTYQVSVSKHLGFHEYSVGLVPDMQTWWNDSPYFDVGFYVNGAENHLHVDTNLNAAWVQSVSGQGWGLMPIWVGYQAPCACVPGTGNGQYGGPSGCDTFANPMSWDPNQAQAQGMQDAANAIKMLGPVTPILPGLNLQGTIVYFDMEHYVSNATCDSVNYDQSCTNATTCGAAVVSFLNGWGSVLKGSQFKVGLYGSPSDGDATSDFTQVSPPPDDVWLAWVPHTTHDTVTVWNVNGSGYNLPDSALPNSLRLVQYTIDNPPNSPCCSETWGTVNVSANAGNTGGYIDKDMEDGQVVASNGTKSYTFTEKPPFSAPDSTAQQTIPQGIGGVSDVAYGGQLPLGEQGKVVGYYVDDLGYSHGFVYDPNSNYFFYPSIDCAGATNTELNGVNSAGLAVGTFQDSSNANWAFTFDTTTAGSSCIKIPCTDCQANGINDAGWIVGSLGSGGFVYKNGSFSTASFGNATDFFAINGQGLVTGSYESSDDTQNYLFFADGSQTAVTLVGQPFQCDTGYQWATGINNNGQMVGAGGPGFFYNSAQCEPVGGDGSGPNDGWTNSLNDFAQIVGFTFARPNLGFLLLPQH